jgi:hypothetical protein
VIAVGWFDRKEPHAARRRELLKVDRQIMPHTCCGVVNKACCAVSVLTKPAFSPPPAPLPPPKRAIACTS